MWDNCALLETLETSMPAALRIALAILVAALAALAGMWLARERPAERLELEHATVLPAPRALPDFALTDHTGAPFGPEQLNGGWHVLFFGFTHCPDVCPSTLATLSAARRQLTDLPAGERPSVVLVSVDPGRDTVERLAEYVAFFDPEFVGVTGDPEALEALTRQLGVAVMVGEPDDSGNYAIDHTATLFLVDPQGRMAAVFGMPHTPDGIAQDYRSILHHTAGRRG
jgi:protein SCO1/2